MSSDKDNLNRRFERERQARKAAEKIAEEKTRELYMANKALQGFNEHLEDTIQLRTQDLERARDQARAANSIKGRFLANMSHELRTPLNAIIGYSEILQEDAEELKLDTIVPDLKKIQSSGLHLLSIVNDILDLSKIEEGMLQLNPVCFHVGDLIDEVVSNLLPVMSKKKNVFEIHCPEMIGEICTDLIRVRQVLYNLLSNAAKFTSGGTVAISAEECEIHGDPGIEFTVQDNGIGISGEQADRVFEIFVQADETTSREFGGTGLGLPISRRLCRMMGGDLTVKSIEGEGSTFTARILADAQSLNEDMSSLLEADATS